MASKQSASTSSKRQLEASSPCGLTPKSKQRARSERTKRPTETSRKKLSFDTSSSSASSNSWSEEEEACLVEYIIHKGFKTWPTTKRPQVVSCSTLTRFCLLAIDRLYSYLLWHGMQCSAAVASHVGSALTSLECNSVHLVSDP